MRCLPALALALTLAPADTARSDAARAKAATPVVEIVTFRLVPGADPAAFRAAAAATDAVLAADPAYGARVLLRGADGAWTDMVRWASLAAAEAAAARMMADPRAVPFMAMIDPATIAMRHDALIWARD